MARLQKFVVMCLMPGLFPNQEHPEIGETVELDPAAVKDLIRPGVLEPVGKPVPVEAAPPAKPTAPPANKAAAAAAAAEAAAKDKAEKDAAAAGKGD